MITEIMTKSAQDDEESAKQITCDALCSLGMDQPATVRSSSHSPKDASNYKNHDTKQERRTSNPKQHQLPMFLSKTYHMIDRCDPSIAGWSESGDSFVVKSVEEFALKVLPQYFKHSNFSSFARQLNFYGFRKLKAEPILTADFDARTASYVRFYHANFQKDQPELLQNIKRATKSDQQSKDDVESMKTEICQLKMEMRDMRTEFERKLTEMNIDYRRRISVLSSEYEKLALLIQQLMASQQGDNNVVRTLSSHQSTTNDVPDMMHSLSHVAALASVQAAREGTGNRKRTAEDENDEGGQQTSSASRPRNV